MNCPESQDLWQWRLDGKPPADAAALEEHLAGCSACRELHAAARRWEQVFRAADRPVAPAGLGDRIVDRFLSERRSGLRWRRRAVVAAALAACFLGVVALGSRLWFAGPRPVPVPLPVAKEYPRRDAPSPRLAESEHRPPAGPAAPSLDESVKDAGSALVALTRRTAHETLGQGRLLLPNVSPPMARPRPDLWQQTVEQPALSLREAGAGVSTGLEPVADSARRAVDMFLQEIPPVPPAGRPGL